MSGWCDACDDDNHPDWTIDDDEEEQDFDNFAYDAVLEPIQLLSEMMMILCND